MRILLMHEFYSQFGIQTLAKRRDEIEGTIRVNPNGEKSELVSIVFLFYYYYFYDD